MATQVSKSQAVWDFCLSSKMCRLLVPTDLGHEGNFSPHPLQALPQTYVRL